jgi:hypothetical protein
MNGKTDGFATGPLETSAHAGRFGTRALMLKALTTDKSADAANQIRQANFA